ncbi:MAG: NAD-dependent epimerase/dehydratase family protein [Pseudomonadota bacterium]
MQPAAELILVGGLGFIGRNILDLLSRETRFADLAPVVIDNMSNAAPGHASVRAPLCQSGYQTETAAAFLSARQRVSGARIFVFLAGETRVADSLERPLDFVEANVTDPARFVTETLVPGDSFILVSTAGALFDGRFEIRPDSPYCPKNFYGATKAAEELILQKLVEQRGGIFRTVRLTNVFGRFSEKKKSAVHAFIRASIAGKSVVINGDGQQSRDFVFASDVAFGIVALAHQMRAGQHTEPVHIFGAGVTTTLMEVVAAIEDAAGCALAYEKVPAQALLATEPRDVIVQNGAVSALLQGHITSLADGIWATYTYYSELAQIDTSGDS